MERIAFALLDTLKDTGLLPIINFLAIVANYYIFRLLVTIKLKEYIAHDEHASAIEALKKELASMKHINDNYLSRDDIYSKFVTIQVYDEHTKSTLDKIFNQMNTMTTLFNQQLESTQKIYEKSLDILKTEAMSLEKRIAALENRN